MIRDREELLEEIQSRDSLSSLFSKWTIQQQEEFLDFCCGEKGIRILYDSFFKEIMNPEYASDRLEDLLSLLLGKKVTILSVLPNDSTRIADEASLLITDIVVELEDGSIANIEVQKIGYLFPGQRSACYSADLLLRQYKRIRGQKQKKFSYKDIKTVYTIVLFEHSPKEFQKFPQEYLHYFEVKSNTGLELELLQKYLFIPLDIFKESIHNKPIKNKTEAWLFFFSADEPDEIIRLIEGYPEFRIMYEEIYNLCLNTEKVMTMFSKELQELDRNTVQYMIDQMQDTIDDLKGTIQSMEDTHQSELQSIEKTYQAKLQSMEQKYNELLEKLQKYES